MLSHGRQPTRLCLWNLPSKNTGVGCHFLLQGIFQTQGLNLCLLQWILYHRATWEAWDYCLASHKTVLGFPGGSDGKESACSVGDLGWEDPLEKGKATYSSIQAWRIPWTV